MRILLASALALLLATPAVAAFEAGPAAPDQAGGFQGPGAKAAVDTVAKALKAADESPVMLEGRILYDSFVLDAMRDGVYVWKTYAGAPGSSSTRTLRSSLLRMPMARSVALRPAASPS